MLKKQVQRYLFTGSYICMWIFQAALILGAVNFVWILQHSNKFVNHSMVVKAAIEQAKDNFLATESKGRYANFDPTAREEHVDMVKRNLAELDRLTDMVADNPEQVENAHILAESAKNRFDIQTKMYSTIEIVDGKLQSNPVLAIDGAGAMTRAVTAFSVIQTRESNLLIERYQKVWDALGTIAALFLAFVILSIPTGIVAYVWTRKTLKDAVGVAQAIREQGAISPEQAEKFAQYIEGKVANLDLTEA